MSILFNRDLFILSRVLVHKPNFQGWNWIYLTCFRVQLLPNDMFRIWWEEISALFPFTVSFILLCLYSYYFFDERNGRNDGIENISAFLDYSPWKIIYLLVMGTHEKNKLVWMMLKVEWNTELGYKKSYYGISSMTGLLYCLLRWTCSMFLLLALFL